jgi:DNA transformation protein and related proteins
MNPTAQTDLAGRVNLGPKSAAMLARSGIATFADLERLGAVHAFLQVQRCGEPASLNLLWALEGALAGLGWQEVARLHRTSLLLALDDARRHESAD